MADTSGVDFIAIASALVAAWAVLSLTGNERERLLHEADRQKQIESAMAQVEKATPVE